MLDLDAVEVHPHRLRKPVLPEAARARVFVRVVVTEVGPVLRLFRLPRKRKQNRANQRQKRGRGQQLLVRARSALIWQLQRLAAPLRARYFIFILVCYSIPLFCGCGFHLRRFLHRRGRSRFFHRHLHRRVRLLFPSFRLFLLEALHGGRRRVEVRERHHDTPKTVSRDLHLGPDRVPRVPPGRVRPAALHYHVRPHLHLPNHLQICVVV
mmetsp:Transcript_27047/g.68169  ORF Transcript_27047/g.68169 Transcript_27047/m.68169 type:complete len:210 (-) Transcript_27047:1173-1802(-)